MKILGVDSGWNNCGIGVLSKSESTNDWVFKVSRHEYMRFEDLKDEMKKRLKGSDDNKIREMFFAFLKIIEEEKPDLVVIENYVLRPFGRAMFSNAWKTGMTVAIFKTVCISKNIPYLSITPTDVKMKLCGKKKATKEEVQEAVQKLFNVNLDDYGRNREHVADALGIAYVGVIEMAKIKATMGLK